MDNKRLPSANLGAHICPIGPICPIPERKAEMPHHHKGVAELQGETQCDDSPRALTLCRQLSSNHPEGVRKSSRGFERSTEAKRKWNANTPGLLQRSHDPEGVEEASSAPKSKFVYVL